MIINPLRMGVIVLLATFAVCVTSPSRQVRAQEQADASPVAWDKQSSEELAMAVHHMHELVNQGKFAEAADMIVGDDVLTTFELGADDNATPVALRSKMDLFRFMKQLFDGAVESDDVTVYLDKPIHRARATKKIGIATEECTVRFRYSNGVERVDKLFGTQVAVKYPDGWKFIQWHMSSAGSSSSHSTDVAPTVTTLKSWMESVEEKKSSAEWSPKQLKGGVSVLNFFLGASCEHCNTQLASLKATQEKFKSVGVNVVCISSKADTEIDDYPFKIVSDADHEMFKTFGCYDKRPTHGTVILNAAGKPIWKMSGDAPFDDMETLISVVKAASRPQVRSPMVLLPTLSAVVSD